MSDTFIPDEQSRLKNRDKSPLPTGTICTFCSSVPRQETTTPIGIRPTRARKEQSCQAQAHQIRFRHTQLLIVPDPRQRSPVFCATSRVAFSTCSLFRSSHGLDRLSACLIHVHGPTLLELELELACHYLALSGRSAAFPLDQCIRKTSKSAVTGSCTGITSRLRTTRLDVSHVTASCWPVLVSTYPDRMKRKPSVANQ